MVGETGLGRVTIERVLKSRATERVGTLRRFQIGDSRPRYTVNSPKRASLGTFRLDLRCGAEHAIKDIDEPSTCVQYRFRILLGV